MGRSVAAEKTDERVPTADEELAAYLGKNRKQNGDRQIHPLDGPEHPVDGTRYLNGLEQHELLDRSQGTNPSAKDIEEKLIAAEKVYAEIAPADREYDYEQADIAEMRKKANTLIKDIILSIG